MTNASADLKTPQAVVLVASHIITFLHSLVEFQKLKTTNSSSKYNLYVFTSQEGALASQHSAFQDVLSTCQASGLLASNYVLRDISSYKESYQRLRAEQNISVFFSTRIDHAVTLSVLRSIRKANSMSNTLSLFEVGESLGTSCSLYSYRAKIRRRLILARLRLLFPVKKLYSVTKSSRRESVLSYLRDCLFCYYQFRDSQQSFGQVLAPIVESSPLHTCVAFLPYLKFSKSLTQSSLSLDIHQAIDLTLVDIYPQLLLSTANILDRISSHIASRLSSADASPSSLIIQPHPKNREHRHLINNLLSIIMPKYLSLSDLAIHSVPAELTSEDIAFFASRSTSSISIYGFGTNLLPAQLMLKGSSSCIFLVPYIGRTQDNRNIYSSNERLRYKHLSALLESTSAI